MEAIEEIMMNVGHVGFGHPRRSMKKLSLIDFNKLEVIKCLMECIRSKVLRKRID